MVVHTSKTVLSQHPPASHLYAGTLYLSNVRKLATEYPYHKRERERKGGLFWRGMGEHPVRIWPLCIPCVLSALLHTSIHNYQQYTQAMSKVDTIAKARICKIRCILFLFLS